MSKLKYRYKKQEEIPAEHAGFYTETAGGWQLDAEGAADAAAIHEQKEAAEKSAQAFAQERKQLETLLAEREAEIAQLRRNRGAGAGPNLHRIEAGESNPFKKETFNLTKQAELTRDNPAKASALRQAAAS